MRKQKFDEMQQAIGLCMKEPHTIVEKWPMRRQFSSSYACSQEEFDLLQSSGHSGSERYVEWKWS